MSYDRNHSIYDLLKLLELAIDDGLALLGQYTVLKRNEIITLLDRIEKDMPEEIVKAQTQLIREGKEKVYKLIDEIRNLLDRGFVIFSSYVVIKKSELLILIDEIYANLPVEIQEARAILKS